MKRCGRTLNKTGLVLMLNFVFGLFGCSGDEAVSLAACTKSIECPRPYVCNFSQCVALEAVDRDGDNVPEEVELINGLDPTNTDSDGDGRSDFEELGFNSSSREYLPLDQDGDGLVDAIEASDQDADGDGYFDQEDPCNLDPNCPAYGGSDNDCSTRVGEACVFGTGACEVLGRLECGQENRNPICVGETIPSRNEQCNGIDDDCDGKTDEDFGAVGSTCTSGVGICRVSGVIQCDSEESASCSVIASEGTEESCDGRDNDCDGRIDEDFDVGQPCQSGRDQCLRPGILDCDDQSGEERCVPDFVDDVPELCDDVDNDCDGFIDEGFEQLGQPCNSANEMCSATGLFACNLEGTAVICSEELIASTPELCNNVDDDCDGGMDEDFLEKGTPCSVGIGECQAAGTFICGPDGISTSCETATPRPSPEAERCDGLDNDCDGETDEAFPNLGETCVTGVGACGRAGHFVCDTITGGSRCDARAGFGTSERCNGIDDDCDGGIDESFPGVGTPCEISLGTCRFSGIEICDATGALQCNGETPIQGDEQCDGIDNDCDGSVDEGLALGEPCELSANTCVNLGSLSCASDGSVFCASPPLPNVEERCDGIDNDCDGRIDESFAELNTPCSLGDGQCTSQGTFECSADQLGLTCNATQTIFPTAELCDGLDNDCNGVIDDPFSTLGDRCASGNYACEVTGHLVCNQAGDGVECNAIARPAEPERCNGIDDDCDGETDEAFPLKNQPCRHGEGICETDGIWQCDLDTGEIQCFAEEFISPILEQCDDLDNDCDGQVDEDYGPGCRRLVVEVSAAGFHTCTLTPDSQILCFGDFDRTPSASRFRQLSGAGDAHCGLTDQGSVECWGSAGLTQGIPTGIFADLSVGRSADACALEAETGMVKCWGNTPSLIASAPQTLEAIEVGDNWACGLSPQDRSIVCWGELPDGTDLPAESDVKALSVGGQVACAIRQNDSLLCWGRDQYGLLSPPVGSFATVDLGGNSGCAINGEGALSCWGLGSLAFPHLGQGVAPSGVAFRTISVGAYHTCGQRDDGTLSCFGAGSPSDPASPFNAGQSSPP